jgi:tetratricopeptide (TPR) repeat protein
MMHKIITIILFCLLCPTIANAQSSREKARKLFLEGKYSEAKPLFQNLLKKAPRDGSYNYWYAVCCYETNDTTANIEKMLQHAVTRKVNNAHRYLGDYYKRNYRYDEAIESYENFIDGCNDEELTTMYEERTEAVKRLQRMMKMTERVCVVDSFIVDKAEFLAAYRTGRDIGTLANAATYFNTPGLQGTVSITERGSDLYYPQTVATDEGNKTKLFHSKNVNQKWDEGQQLEGIETGGNDNYPFMSVDGSTFYFASDGEGSIGGYDIFVTRYNSEDGSYLKPENVGMPFNSEANDYLLVVNDIANLGWFATDRRMDEGKVCVYVFIPNSTKVTYNYEAENAEKMIGLSQLTSIAATQEDAEAVRKAHQQLLKLAYEQKEIQKRSDFLFIIDDLTEYTSLQQFKSEEARKLYGEWKKRQQKQSENSATLEKRREEYSKANAGTKQSMKASLLKLEQQVLDEAEALAEMEIQIRNTEKRYISK